MSPALSDAEVDALGGDGWFVRDGFLGADRALAARDAARSLAAAEALRAPGLGRGADHRLDPTVRGDQTAWLRDHLADPRLAVVSARFEALRVELNAATWLGLTHFTVQLACYPGGGAGYARHLDALRGSINRVVTAIVYLNPEWLPEHGGLLRLFVTGTPEEAPLLDRLVVFRSDAVPHEVCPTFAERWALTAWFRKRDPERPAI